MREKSWESERGGQGETEKKKLYLSTKVKDNRKEKRKKERETDKRDTKKSAIVDRGRRRKRGKLSFICKQSVPSDTLDDFYCRSSQSKSNCFSRFFCALRVLPLYIGTLSMFKSHNFDQKKKKLKTQNTEFEIKTKIT